MDLSFYKKILAWGSIFFLTHTALYAQNGEIWSLKKCLNYAQEHNLQLKQLNLQTQSAGINEWQSKKNRLPNLNGGASTGINLGRSIDPTTNSFNTQATAAAQLSLNSSITLYNGGLLKHTIEQRGMELQLAKLQTEEAANNLQLNILGAYLQILLSEAQVGVLDKQAQLTQDQYKQIEKLVQAGTLPAGNLLDIEAQIATDKLNRVNGKNAVASAFLNLQQLLEYYQKFDIERPKAPEPNEADLAGRNPETTFQQALNTQPSLKRSTLQTSIAQQRLKLINANKYPIVSLNANLSTRYSSLAQRLASQTPIGLAQAPLVTESGETIFSPLFDYEKTPLFSQLTDNWGGYLGVSVTIPIFNQYQVKNNYALAKINIQNSEINEQSAKNQLRQRIEQAYLDAYAALERYRSTQTSIEALQKSLTHTEKRYNVGLANSFDYTNAKNRLATAELNLETTKFDYLFRLKIIDFYEGKPINL
jgi:outer membrane protein